MVPTKILETSPKNLYYRGWKKKKEKKRKEKKKRRNGFVGNRFAERVNVLRRLGTTPVWHGVVRGNGERRMRGNRREIVLPGRIRMENADWERGHNSVPGPNVVTSWPGEGIVDSYLSIVSSSPRGGCSWNPRGVRNGDIGKCEISGDERDGTVWGASY